ncbi:MAG TPA: chemotaxis response regulator protein-glutamate methylesterase [Candidatus Deferrimicrobiaceae bacterium]|nr:chemotaxis response regulator protein-glutamate methylesterase [Candidatus Deferrimicrobiaceae bacterium]
MNTRLNGNALQVLVVDDSAMVRQVMQAILSTDRRINVKAAADPLIAWAKMQKESPDVVITDLEMPRMDGLTFIRKIMSEMPTPVVVCSGLAARGTELAFRALEEGAVEVITKPKVGVRDFLHESAVTLVDAVWSASLAQMKLRPLAAPRMTADDILPRKHKSSSAVPPNAVIAVGASTGGTEALRLLLGALPTDCPPVVIVQHMPEVFTRAFAERLNKECAIEILEARDGVRLQNGRALIAPGNRHMLVNRSGEEFVVQIIDGPLVSRHRPSVDVLFRSVAIAAGSKAIGIIMTGMGDDGAEGLSEMKEAGAATIAQDEASCVVFGMPKEAIARGAVDVVMPLEQIASAALSLQSR